MKLVYISNAKLPTPKAHGLQIMKSCEAFASNGVDVTLFLPNRINDMPEDPFEYYGVKKVFKIQKLISLNIGLLPERLRFYLQINSFAFFVIFQKFEGVIYSRDVIVLFFLCFFGYKPVAEIHDYRSQESRWWMEYILKKSKRIIANSEGTKQLLSSHYPSIKDIFVVSNAVDLDFFAIPESKQEAREKLRLPQDKIIIGYVGRLSVAGQDKGVQSLRDAFQIMKHKEKAELLIVGGPELSVPYSEVPMYLRAIDIAVIPFPSGQHAKTTSPIKYYEYLASGKAIIVAESQDAKILARKLDELVADPDRINSLGAKSLEESKNHTWSQRAKIILKIIS